MTYSKSSMPCNKPRKSNRPGKKRMVKACSGGKEKLIHYGASGYGHNYSTAARKSFRARHKCDSAKDKLTARYWACKDLWTKGSDSKACPPGRACKYNHSRRQSSSSSRRRSRSLRQSNSSSRRRSRSRRQSNSSSRRRSRSRRKRSNRQKQKKSRTKPRRRKSQR